MFPAVRQLCVHKLLQRVNTALVGRRSKPTGALTRSNWPPAPAPERCRPHVRPAERAVGVALERHVDVDEVEDVDAGTQHPDPVVIHQLAEAHRARTRPWEREQLGGGACEETRRKMRHPSDKLYLA